MPRQSVSHIDSREEFASRLRQARREAQLRQKDLASDGCSISYISRLEKGERIPSLQLIRELADRLGVSEIWLAKGGSRQTDAVSRIIRILRRLTELLSPDQLETELAEVEEALGQLASEVLTEIHRNRVREELETAIAEAQASGLSANELRAAMETTITGS